MSDRSLSYTLFLTRCLPTRRMITLITYTNSTHDYSPRTLIKQHFTYTLTHFFFQYPSYTTHHCSTYFTLTLSAQKIANLADRFVQDNAQILVHGSLEPVKALLQGPATRKRFSVLVTESQPTGVGLFEI